ncbi:DUF411 domain-containing protein [Neorhizobium sp. NCHU2750]|uniref:DUF411 domain-containing protein n=1 Tax=Neorhizobium sp. NCHU2750 TaxID=1825976 RepID=UPI000E744999|nr:metal-binding protein [Neorhizobium sp. NCHU2750]
MNTRLFAARSLAFIMLCAASVIATGAAAAEMVVYKSPYCQCCEAWVAALKAAGIPLRIENTEDMDAVKASYHVPEEAQSCHTAVADGYVFEGHVPLDVVKQVLAEHPDIAGFAVPGMPSGALGMGGDSHEAYDIIALNKDGSQSLYRHVTP